MKLFKEELTQQEHTEALIGKSLLAIGLATWVILGIIILSVTGVI